MRLKPQALLSLCIVMLAVWALLSTRAWHIKTALYPIVVGVPLLLLAAVEFVLSLRGEEADAGERAMDFELSGGVEPKVARQRTMAIFAWLIGFFVTIVLLGFPLATPLFVFAYLKGQAKERWLLTLVLVGLAWLLFDALFVRLLHLPFPQGLLFRLLR